jgi:hypothetical protein
MRLIRRSMCLPEDINKSWSVMLGNQRRAHHSCSSTSDVISLQLCFLAHSTSLPSATYLSWLAVWKKGPSVTRKGCLCLTQKLGVSNEEWGYQDPHVALPYVTRVPSFFVGPLQLWQLSPSIARQEALRTDLRITQHS